MKPTGLTSIKHSSNVAHGRERLWVYLAEHLFLELERLAVYDLRFSVLSLTVK